MPLHRAARNCRAVSRQADFAVDGIWISDSLLFDSFNRFYNVSSRPIRRMASNTPGPLESRRRTGKRPMTAAPFADSGSALPTWALPTISDLTQWSWKAPNDPLERFRQRELDLTTVWPFSLVVPRKAESEEAVSLASEQENVAMMPVIRSFISEVDDLKASVATIDEETLRRRFGVLLKELKQQLALAALTEEQLMDMSKSLLTAIRTRYGADARITTRLSFALYEAMADGIKACKLLLPANYSISLWESMLTGISSLPPSKRLCMGFGNLLKLIPADILNKLELPILLVLETLASYQATQDWDHNHIGQSLIELHTTASRLDKQLANAEQAVRRGDVETCLKTMDLARQSWSVSIAAATKAEFLLTEGNKTAELARMLRTLSCSANGPLLEKAEQLFSTRGDNVEQRRESSLRWLAVLAQMPRVGQEHLLKSARSTEISNVELGQLCIMHWKSQRCFPSRKGLRWESLDDSARSLQLKLQYFHGLCAWREEESLAALFLTGAYDARKAALALAHDLHDWKGPDLIKSFEGFLHLRRIPDSFLQELAYELSDVNDVLRMKALYASQHEGSTSSRSLWHPRSWGKFAPRMIRDLERGNLSPLEVYQALDLSMYTRRNINCPVNGVRYRSFVAPTVVVLVENLATHLAQNKQLGSRWALRRVYQCLVFLKARRAREYNVVRVLAQVLMLDLRTSQRGRNSRLEWLMSMVLRQFGRDAAVKLDKELLRWRASIAFRLRAKRRWAHALGEHEPFSGGRRKASLRQWVDGIGASIEQPGQSQGGSG